MSNEVTIPVSDVSLSAALRTRWSQTFAGDIVHYEVSAANEGAQAVADAALDLNMPSGLTFLAGSVTIGDIRSPGASPVGGIPVGGIPAGGSVSVAFDAQVGDLPNDSILTCEAVVHYTVGGEQFTATTNAVSIVVVKPEVALTLSASPLVAAPGDAIAYALVAYNASDFAVEATLTGYLPAGLAPAGGIVVIDGRQVAVAAADASIPLGIIGPGARVYISFKAVVPSIAGGAAPSLYTNEARLVYVFRLNDGRAVGSSVLSNSVSVRIISPVIQVVVSADPSNVYPGEGFRIRAEVSNTGNAAADTILTNLLPVGARFAGYSVHVDGAPTAIVLDGSVALGMLKPGERRRIEYRLTVPEHTDEEVIDGVLIARYRFEVAGSPRAGESRSNAYQVSILSQDE
ncbi:hypothetical protein [Cohnella sp. 56]|uniref:hypothetical protein n=1 Tax=Cohnella sp. 56 TaxID=3113722 RepID=UPI0030EAF958